jgi:ATP-dependent 26S proteasome regulatory subunit
MDSLYHQLEQHLVNDPFNHELRLKYARALQDQSLWEQSLKQYALLIQQKVETARIYTDVALCLYQLERKKEAVDKYMAARKYENFIPHPELEAVIDQARLAKPGLKVITGGPGTAEVIALYPKDENETRFKDIAGMEALKKVLRMQIIEPFLKPGIFARFKKKAGGGILLYGPPGCGKTMMAKAIAKECHASFISVGISDVLNMWIGESEKNLAAIFEKARASKPSLLFFDELDALAYSRSKSNSHHSRTVVNEFLAQLDGIDSHNDQILILSASNMPWDIDPAMKRPGRFSRQIFVPPPDAAAREEMLRLKLQGVPCDEISFSNIARISDNYSGADIDGVIDHAKEFVLMDILETGVERNLTQDDLLKAIREYHPSTLEWLKTARNLVKYAGADDSYRDVEKYLKSEKML